MQIVEPMPPRRLPLRFISTHDATFFFRFRQGRRQRVQQLRIDPIQPLPHRPQIDRRGRLARRLRQQTV
ncbi:hypothetical protein AB4084_23730, partial [Lysobacter sp. 2RAB21]